MNRRRLPFHASIERDGQGTVRQLRHLQYPFTDKEIDPTSPNCAQRLIVSYLRRVGDLFGLTVDQIDWLEERIGSSDPYAASGLPGIQLRWDERSPHAIRRNESTVLWTRQTYGLRDRRGNVRAFDVWQSGLRIVVHRQPLRITSSASTIKLDLKPVFPTGVAIRRIDFAQFAPDNVIRVLSGILGLPIEGLRHTISEFRPLIYRVNRDDLRDSFQRVGDSHPLGSRPDPSEIPAEGADIPVAWAEVPLPTKIDSILGYRFLVDTTGAQIVYSKVLTACAQTSAITAPRASVFVTDPRTSSGSTASGPDDYNIKLNNYRSRVALAGLAPPASGNLMLTGELISIRDPRGDKGGPAEPSPFRFDYDARTFRFAAVNAYFHCDAMFRMLMQFGFDLDEYFADKQFPIAVRPWAPIIPGPCVDGLCVNAQVLQAAGSNFVNEFRFALGDLSDVQYWRGMDHGFQSGTTPLLDVTDLLGVATDVRWVWHEFCHALLIAATWEPEFMFAHSAGDALAAIACDPHTALDERRGQWRGVTFPWIAEPLRRHDREAAEGWGWYGELYDPDNYPPFADPMGYRAEQILSSTLFRAYRSIGGDALDAAGKPNVARRQAAADYMLYLITRGIAQLGDATVVPAVDARFFAGALMEADVATGVFTYHGISRPGGTVHKVIRWAFEKQGLYQASGVQHPQDGPGLPEPVDLYIDDLADRRGEYQFTDQWHASTDALWLRDAPDGGSNDQSPAQAKKSYVYVRVDNRGTQAGTGTQVSVYAAAAAALDTWGGAGWTMLMPSPSATVQATVMPGDWIVFGPFEWTPASSGAVALLAAASAPGDLANIVPTTGLPCATGPTAIATLVPLDNNLGYRRWAI